MVSDAQDRPRTFAAVTKGLIRIRLGRSGDGVGIGLDALFILLRRFHPFFFQVKIILIPGGLSPFHPERTNLNWVLRTFVLSPAGLLGRRAHEKRSSRNGDHLELDLSVRNGFYIILMIKFVDLGLERGVGFHNRGAAG